MKNIDIYKPNFDNKEYIETLKILKSGWISTGKVTEKFEKKLQAVINSKNILAVNSCTSGINLVLETLSLKPGDEVITTLLTFISTIHSLYRHKLKVKFIDINKTDFSMNLEELKKKISEKTKLVLVNHYGGIPSDTKKIIKICKRKKIFVLEDAATVLGAKIAKKYIGSFNYATTVFSLQANKIITIGEGGIISTNNNIFAKKLKEKSLNGFRNGDVIHHGYKYNFSDINASIGLVQLKKLKTFLNYRSKLRLIYNNELNVLEKRNLINFYKKQKNKTISEYIYTIVIKNSKLIKFLENHNIQTRVHYLTANETKFYKNKFTYKNITNSIFISKNILSLPFHNSLTKKEVVYICKIIKKFFKVKPSE